MQRKRQKCNQVMEKWLVANSSVQLKNEIVVIFVRIDKKNKTEMTEMTEETEETDHLVHKA